MPRKRTDFEVPRFERELRCACGASIVFRVTSRGAYQPLDLSTVEYRDGIPFAESHQAHCPELPRFARPRIKARK